jgi:hypothetical protein
MDQIVLYLIINNVVEEFNKYSIFNPNAIQFTKMFQSKQHEDVKILKKLIFILCIKLKFSFP